MNDNPRDRTGQGDAPADPVPPLRSAAPSVRVVLRTSVVRVRLKHDKERSE